MAQMTLVTGTERRRQWSFDERQEIVAAASAPGAVVSEVGRLVGHRMALINQLRAVLLERNIAFPQGRRKQEACLEIYINAA